MAASVSLISVWEGSYRFSKRAIDLILSVFGLVFLAPLILAIAVFVRLSSSGPIIFKQDRLGLNGKPFTIYKFSMMREGSHKISLITLHRDERITWVGKIFRPFHFDELPQFWNIIKGDMTLVGPRPDSIGLGKEISEYIPNYLDRLQVMPGLTGLAQVNRGHDVSKEVIKRSFELDMQYIANRSLLLDLSILARTVIVVIKRNGN